MVTGLTQYRSSAIAKRAWRATVLVLDCARLKQLVKALVHGLIQLGVPQVRPQIVRVLHHDTAALTQGLVYQDGILYESTGGTNSSSLRQLDACDGNLLRLVRVENDFAEGIAIFASRLYQLSWKSGVTRIYRIPELQKIGEVRYQGEGWGLAASDDGLIMTNGSSVITFRDDQLVIRRHLSVHARGVRVRGLNDIERVGNRLYGNVYGTTDIFEICLLTGRLVRVIRGGILYEAADPDDNESVMNGIAYNPNGDTFFATGKKWRYIFEFRLPRESLDESGPSS